MSAIEQHGHSPSMSLSKFFGTIGQDVCRFSHEVNATEHDCLTRLTVGGHLTQLVTVATQIRVRNDFVLLIMMTEDQQRIAQLVANGLDPSIQCFGIECLVGSQIMNGFRTSVEGDEIISAQLVLPCGAKTDS
jgi:hypothetical protein